MSEFKARGVEKLATGFCHFYLPYFDLRGCAVERVADYRMMFGGEVGANLVRAAGMDKNFEERSVGQGEECAPIRAGFTGLAKHGGATCGHAHAALGIACDGQFDATLRSLQFSLHKS